jgi:hypothetical protein
MHFARGSFATLGIMSKATQVYADSSAIHVGHRVIYNGQVGTVVVVNDSEEYSTDFSAAAWSEHKTGFLIRFDNGALLHLDAPDEHFARDENETV